MYCIYLYAKSLFPRVRDPLCLVVSCSLIKASMSSISNTPSGRTLVLGNGDLDVAVSQVDHTRFGDFLRRDTRRSDLELLLGNGWRNGSRFRLVFIGRFHRIQAGTPLQVDLPELFPRRKGSLSGLLGFVIEIVLASFQFAKAIEMYQVQLFPRGLLVVLNTGTDFLFFGHDGGWRMEDVGGAGAVVVLLRLFCLWILVDNSRITPTVPPWWNLAKAVGF
jgi:hypothetical protein